MISKNLSHLTLACILSMSAATASSDAASPSKAGAENSITTAKIIRDGFGTPHIYAQDEYDLFYGYGYVLGEDRLYQLDMLRRSTQGKVAEVLGKEFAAFDQKQRTLFWPEDIRKQISALDENMQQLFKGYAAGINKRISQVLDDPENLMPYEFNANGFRPEYWTDYDVVMMFVGSMLLRFGDFNTEIENQQFLADLIKAHGKDDAWKIFNAVIPRSNDFAPTTIPSVDWQKIAATPPPPRQEKTSQSSMANLTAALSPFTPKKRGRAFSNALVLGPERLEGAKSLLVNGPQFGWFAPAYTYSVGFHMPGWDAVGNAPLGYPLPMFGYNKHIAWGSTWGVIDNVDIFRESLNPENPRQYKHQGQWKTFRAREEVIKVKGAEDVKFTAYNSIHGPIIHQDSQQNHAYAKNRGWAGRELKTLIGWIEATRAKNHDQWLKAVKKSAINVNWYFADQKGNIAYGSMGAFPERRAGHDNRLPVSGEGKMDWHGIQSPSKNPQILNPSSHYVANWNNKPGAGVANPDEWWSSWAEADRIRIIDDAMKEAGKLTPEEAWDLIMQASFKDPNASFFLPHMLAALEKAGDKNPLYATLKTALSDWDGTYKKTTGHGSANASQNSYEHPGNAIFRFWITEMMASVLSDDLSGTIGNIIAHNTEYGTPDAPIMGGHDIPVGFKLLHEIIQGRSDYDFLNGKHKDEMWLASLEKSITKLTDKFGPDVKKWQLPVPATQFSHINFLGVPQALAASARNDLPAMNRGTENNMTILKSEGSIGYEIVPPGQSGFINPKGVKAKHFDDQYLMYLNLEKKRTWLYKKDVDAHAERQYTLTIKRP